MVGLTNTISQCVGRLKEKQDYMVVKAQVITKLGQLEFKENGNGSGNGKWELVRIVVIHRILYQ